MVIPELLEVYEQFSQTDKQFPTPAFIETGMEWKQREGLQRCVHSWLCTNGFSIGEQT